MARVPRVLRVDRPDLPRRYGRRSALHETALGGSAGIGVVSFVGPFLVASAAAYLLLDWSARASLITGTALSTTSLAVVYAVLVERRLTDTGIGKLLMSATFVTDLCTALALSGSSSRRTPGSLSSCSSRWR